MKSHTSVIRGMAVVALLGLGSQACVQPRPGGTVAADRPECPFDSVAIPVTRKVRETTTTTTLTVIPVSGPITNVPEYHDCQRFINPPAYGPMVAIFAHHALDSMYDQITDSVAGVALQAAAEIYSYDGDYDNLHIQRGFNCLYLTRTSGVWAARIVWVDQDADACLKPPVSSGHPLQVRPQSFPGLQEPDVPPVARWDWDPRRSQQYISIRCGREWCEVGPSGFSSSAGLGSPTLPDLDASTPAEVQRVLRIKGWYDEQYLALPGTGPFGLNPSLIRGTAIPHPMLERLTTVAHFTGQWRPSAYIRLDAPALDYSTKLGLQQGLNRIFMCQGDFSGCPNTAGIPQPICDAAADGQWWAKVVSPSGASPTYFCVIRRTHPGVVIPGTVRWRWDSDDEKTWIRCPEGCCTVS